jgi:hypothetical protein
MGATSRPLPDCNALNDFETSALSHSKDDHDDCRGEERMSKIKERRRSSRRQRRRGKGGEVGKGNRRG